MPDRIFQELAIQLIADGGNVAALLRAQDVAGPADFQVAHGNLEAGPQLGEFLNRLEAARGLRRDRPVAVEQHVGVSPMLESSDAAAQLMQIRKPVVVGLIDEDRVDVGNIQAALDDRRRHQDVGFAADELDHGFFQLMLVHLAMADDDTSLGHDLTQFVGDVVDVVARGYGRNKPARRD